MKLKLIVLLIAICAAVAARADDTARDGTFWRSMSKECKPLYLAGMFDGMIGGDFFIPSSTAESILEYHSKLQEMLGRSTTGTIRDGLDEFYKDFKNRNIKLSRAIVVVAAQINGASDEKIQGMTEHLRQWKDQ